VWRDALTTFGAHPQEWVPGGVLLVATPIVQAADADISEDALSENVFNSNTSTGDALAIAFGAVPVILGGYDAFSGDGGQALEVTGESLAVTMALTQVLKVTVNRERPDGSSEDSFPSGHTSFSFAGATLIARWIDARSEGPFDWLGYLLYVPAAYVGVSRLEGDKHFLSDITFGAALGVLTTNLIWDAHYGYEEEHLPGIYGRKPRARVRWQPIVSPSGGIGIGLALDF
jgi:hypothetical protein